MFHFLSWHTTISCPHKWLYRLVNSIVYSICPELLRTYWLTRTRKNRGQIPPQNSSRVFEPKGPKTLLYCGIPRLWCRERELNPYVRRHTPLKRVGLYESLKSLVYQRFRPFSRPTFAKVPTRLCIILVLFEASIHAWRRVGKGACGKTDSTISLLVLIYIGKWLRGIWAIHWPQIHRIVI